MIGDSDKDVGAANNMRIDSILFHSSEHKKFYDIEKLRELSPTYIVEDFREVLEIV
jgi:phosphoglycolate phosphatase-like HAD superfamily hydrolase